MDLKKWEQAALEIAKTDGKAMAKKMVVSVIMPMIKEMVEASPTKYDDMFYPMIEQSLLKLLEGI